MSVEHVAFDLDRAHDKISKAPIDTLKGQVTELSEAAAMAAKLREVMAWLHAKGKVAKEAAASAKQSHEGFADGLAAMLSAVGGEETENSHAIAALTDATTLERRSDYLQGDIARLPSDFDSAYRALGSAVLSVDQIAMKSQGMGSDLEDQVAGRDHALGEITAYKQAVTGASSF